MLSCKTSDVGSLRLEDVRPPINGAGPTAAAKLQERSRPQPLPVPPGLRSQLCPIELRPVPHTLRLPHDGAYAYFADISLSREQHGVWD